MVLGQVKNAAIFRNLHVERPLRLKAMLPIQRETQEVEIEFLRFLFVEDAQNGDGRSQFHGGGLYDEFESLVILGADGIFRILSGDSRLQGMLIETNKRAE